MYVRHTTISTAGKTHSCWRLVRSVRRGRKVFHETVAHLGELDAQGRARARRLAVEITGGHEQYELFEAPVSGEPVAVRVEQVRLERARRFGDVWLGWRLWCALGLDRFRAGQMLEGRERVPWSTMAAILVIARLCEPSSELRIAQDWYRRTALPDLLGVPAGRVNDDRLYRALDELLPHKAALEGHLKQRLGELFALDYELLLYDVTSTCFEGEAAANPLARRGHSRGHRGGCKQICTGLVVTREGIPLGDEVFVFNRNGVTTVEEMALKKLAPQLTDARDWLYYAYPVGCHNPCLRWLRHAGAILIIVFVFGVPSVGKAVASISHAYARECEPPLNLCRVGVNNRSPKVMRVRDTESLSGSQSMLQFAGQSMGIGTKLTSRKNNWTELIVAPCSHSLPIAIRGRELENALDNFAGTTASVYEREGDRIIFPWRAIRSLSYRPSDFAHDQFRSVTRNEFTSKLASLANTDDNQPSSYDSEDDGKGSNHRISDFELAPKFMAPFIIFFCGLSITVCGIFFQIKAGSYVGTGIGAIFIIVGPLGALGCMWLWALRLL